MIGRLQHPSDASSSLYVALLYCAASGDWQPLEDGFHATKIGAITACVKELEKRAIELNTKSDELQINLGRLVEKASREDIVHIGGVLHVLDAQSGYLVSVDSPAPGITEGLPFEVVTDDGMGNLSGAQEHRRMLLYADKLEQTAGILRELAEEWRRVASGRLPPGNTGATA